jgi:hypothetical protein
MNCCGYNVSQILVDGEKMSSTQYEQRRVPHFDEWWESDENDLLGLVDIDVAKEIWVAAYLAGMKAEREECAKWAEGWEYLPENNFTKAQIVENMCKTISHYIRARGKHEPR